MILFVFVPGFYASVEQADHPELRGRPVLVGGDPRKRGTVTSASQEARASGVVEGEPMSDALDRCPDAEARLTRLRRYREVATAVRAVVHSRSERIEPDGLTGVYLEVPMGIDAVSLAAELCVRVRGEVGIPAVAGGGPTRFVANMAAQHCGPGGIRIVEAEDVRRFLGELPLTAIWGLGPASAERLERNGIRSIGDLQTRPLEELEAAVGRMAGGFHRLALGRDEDRIRARPRPKSISQEETLASPTTDLGVLTERLIELAGRVAGVLEREGRAARTVSLGMAYVDDQQVTRSQTEERPVSTQAELRDVSYALLGRARPGSRAVRRLRLQVSNLCAREGARAPQQLRLL